MEITSIMLHGAAMCKPVAERTLTGQQTKNAAPVCRQISQAPDTRRSK